MSLIKLISKFILFKGRNIPKIKKEDIPTNDDDVFHFCMRFNAYNYYGSFEKAAAAARRKDNSTVLGIMTQLFMSARASNHRMDKAYLDDFKELKPHLEKLLEN